MQSTVSPAGYESTVPERRTLGGMLAFVALVAGTLLAVSHPGVVAAAVLGALGATLVRRFGLDD